MNMRIRSYLPISSLLTFCTLFYFSGGCSHRNQSEPFYKGVVAFGKTKTFPVETLTGTEEAGGDKHRVEMFRGREGENSVKVIWDSSGWNGIAILDSHGNTIVAQNKGLITEDGVKPSYSAMEVVTADMNADLKNDYFIILRSAGVGLVNQDQCVFFLSNDAGYTCRIFTTYESESGNLVDLNGDGRCFLIIQELIENPGVKLPPLNPSEFPKPPKGISEKDKEMFYKMTSSDLYFYVTYPLEISGTNIKEVSDGAFPIFSSYFRGERKNVLETKLLTESQKDRIWRKNINGFAGLPIRDIRFMDN
jgi:hypothetical protein